MPSLRLAAAVAELGSLDVADMPLPSDFWEQLARKTDAELYDMLAHQDDYLPEAVAAAKDEMSRRKLAPERVAQLEATVQLQDAAANTKAQERLGWPMRILVFVVCSGILGIVLALYYENRGYKKKASDCWITLGISVAVHVLIGIFVAVQ